VLISAGDLTGYELGSNVLNPYRDFQSLHPTSVIEHGVFVFDGTFNVPLASALGHVQKAWRLRNRSQLEEALAEAQTAVDLAPEGMQPRMVLGSVLTAMNRTGEARLAYEKALEIAKTMEPGAQKEWVERIQGRLASK
jgi:tetratricopeptide (TPR) repeat protein